MLSPLDSIMYFKVINMLFAEWNQEEALAVRYNEGINKGRNEGKEKNAKKVLDPDVSYNGLNTLNS